MNATKKMASKQPILWLITFLIPAILFFAMPVNETLTPEMRNFFVITLCGVFAWMFELLPAFITGLLMTVGYIIFKVATPQVAFASWNNQVVWLCLAGLMVGAAFEKTGLLKRIAFFCIRKTGYSYKGIVIGLILSGVIISVLLPNLSARVTLYTFLGLGICKAMNLEKKDPTAAGIMLSSFLAAVGSRYIMPSSNDETVLAMSLLEQPVALKDAVLANAPITLVWVAVIIFMMLFLFKPKTAIDCRGYIDSEWEKLGKMSSGEIKFLVMLLAALVCIYTNIIGLGWCFLLIACICFVPGVDILDTKDVGKMNFGMIIFVACALTIGNVAVALGVGPMVANAAISFIGSTTLSRFVFYPVIWLFGVIVTVLMTPLAAVAGFTVPLTGLASAAGMSAVGTVWTFAMGVEQIIFPYEWAAALFTFSFGYIDSKQFLKFGAARMLLNLLFLLIIAIPFWSLVHFV